ncbi:MAG TPA: hypothetical protein VNI52_14490 [Sphingobacteriaceae bacterium]|nr:hypothetical protein [Sphingobacteriaceae bacterium]
MIKDEVTDRSLLNNPLLDFISIHKETGEVPTASDRNCDRRHNYKSASYKGLDIRVYDSGTVLIAGSLHYFFNEGLHNYNQFTISDLTHTLNKLQTELGINPNTARIQTLEFGVNLTTDPTPFINSLVTHKTNQFNRFDIVNSNGKQTLQKGRRCGLKVYDKGLQFRHLTDNDILRFEYKCLKMELIRKEPVYLADLIKPDIIDRCGKLLDQAFKDLIIKEPVNLKDLTGREREFYLKGINPAYWNTLTKQRRYKNRIRFNRLLDVHSTDRIKDKTYKTFLKTLQNITVSDPEKGYFLTDILEPERLLSDRLDNKSLSNPNRFNPMRCISCNRDISGQKAGSKFCSEKTFGKDAKKCRNKNSNPRNNFIRKIHYVESKGLLFPLDQFIKIPENLELNINRL